MRPGVTLEDITRAADQMLFAGHRPTVEGVRNILGTGSPATVNRHLNDYYLRLKDRLTLPPAIAAAAAELHTKIRVVAQAAVDEHEIKLQHALRRDREQLAAERSAFESEKMALRDQVAALSAEVLQLRDAGQGQERRLTDLEQQLASESRFAAAAEARAQAGETERQRIVQSHQAELQRLRERAEGNEKHFLEQIDQLRLENKRLIAEKDKESTAAAKRIRDLETQLVSAATELAVVNKDHGRLQTENAREREKRIAFEATLASETERHGKELGMLRAQRDHIVNEASREREVQETLRKERDEALQQAALYRGKAQVLQAQLERSSSQDGTLEKSLGNSPVGSRTSTNESK